MPTGATGAALSGAAQGAATGTAIMPGWGTAIGAVVGGIGGYLSASGTQSAQNQQNAAAAQQAAMQSAQAFNNYLSSRGISLQQVAAANPRFEQEYNRVRAAGDKRSFDVWLYEHLRSAPNDPAWQQINTGSVGAQNTTLPNYAVDANGNPLQPSLLNQLVGIQSGTNNPANAPIGSLATLANARALLQARPDLAAELAAAGVGDDGRTVEQWLVDHITQTEAASGGGTFTDALRQFAVQQATTGTNAAGPAGTGNPTTLDPAIAALIPQSAATVGSIFDGSLLNQVTAALKPVQDARTAGVTAIGNRTNELRGLSGNLLNTELAGITGVLDARTRGAGSIFDASIAGATGVRDAATTGAQGVYDTNVAKLADLLGVRRDAAAQIYDASIGAAGGVRDARTTGAKGIYDAENLRADTYAQSAQDALGRILAEQTAERARRGFTGGSSGSGIVRARLMADYTQRGAGERAQAGVNYQGRLSDAGIGYATDAGRAGVGRAQTLGLASEQDSIGKLNAAVDLARQMGLIGTNFATASGNAGVTRASSLAGAGEQNAIAQLQATVADATRRLGYLTSDADIARANADLANAQDALKALLDDQNRRVGATSAPFQLAGADLSLKDALTNQQYGGIDALLRRLSGFSTTPASGPQLTTSTPGAVLNNTQIAGGVLSGLGSVIGNTSNQQSLAELIKLLGGGNGANTTPAATPTAANGYGLGGSPGFLAGASVFGGP